MKSQDRAVPKGPCPADFGNCKDLEQERSQKTQQNEGVRVTTGGTYWGGRRGAAGEDKEEDMGERTGDTGGAGGVGERRRESHRRA